MAKNVSKNGYLVRIGICALMLIGQLSVMIANKSFHIVGIGLVLFFIFILMILISGYKKLPKS